MILASKALTAFSIALGLSLSVSAAQAEERTVSAYSSWQSRGQLIPTGIDHATFIGAFSGTLFIDEDSGGLNEGGNITCPGTMELNLETGSQVGRGKCVISNSLGERVYATWTCEGGHGTGCIGDFKLVEGTGDYEGVTGGGPFVLRAGVQNVAMMAPGNIIQHAAGGMAIWRDLNINIPEKTDAEE